MSAPAPQHRRDSATAAGLREAVKSTVELRRIDFISMVVSIYPNPRPKAPSRLANKRENECDAIEQTAL